MVKRKLELRQEKRKQRCLTLHNQQATENKTIAKGTLKRVWGYDSFRSGQLDMILNLMNGKDVMLIKPTGGGKSLVFQLPMLLLPEDQIGLVVSPLISLMKDQVETLKAKGVQAEFLSSNESKNENNEKKARVIRGKVKILYVTPERLEFWSQSNFFEKLPKIGILAVDEAHCISQWGHSFRTSFRNLGRVREDLGYPVCLAATATATARVRDDTIKNLRIQEAEVFVESIIRPNIKIRIIRRNFNNISEKIDYIQRHLMNKDELSVIYAGTRNCSDDVKTAIQDDDEFLSEFDKEDEGFIVEAYHGGLSTRARKEAQDRFMKSARGCLGATSAFGMGIDKSNIRHVFHLRPTECLESYVQQIGRAGRDGKPAMATLFCSDNRDWDLANMFLETSWPNADQVRVFFNYLYENKENGWVRKKIMEFDCPDDIKAMSRCRVILVELNMIEERNEQRFIISNVVESFTGLDKIEKLVFDEIIRLDVEYEGEDFMVTTHQIFDLIEEDLPCYGDFDSKHVTKALRDLHCKGRLHRKYDHSCKAIRVIGTPADLEGAVLDYVDDTHRQAHERLSQMRQFVRLQSGYWKFIDDYFKQSIGVS